jgi:hypothetical protein
MATSSVSARGETVTGGSVLIVTLRLGSWVAEEGRGDGLTGGWLGLRGSVSRRRGDKA